MTVLASHCEAKLHGFRRTADGVVVSFVLHPAEVPKALALDPLGTRYMLALAQIGDDEQPVPPAGPSSPQRKEIATEGPPEVVSKRQTPSPAGGHKERRSWDELAPQQQAGILCSDKGFQQWLTYSTGDVFRDEEDAAGWLRRKLGIESRRDLATRPHLVQKLNRIRAEFLEWAGRVPTPVR